tara:strand:+ start:300 stop:416 length:117 start_codon:yes stop_codon:yes gene_type:complete
MKRFKTVDESIENPEQYQEELIRLREILNGAKAERQIS